MLKLCLSIVLIIGISDLIMVKSIIDLNTELKLTNQELIKELENIDK